MQAHDTRAAAVELLGITKRFGPLLANDGIDLTVAQRSIHALVGENGAGKSTLMKILAGVLRPDAGEIRLHGERLPRHDARSAIRHGLGMVYQHFMLVDPLTVAENLVLGDEPRRRGLFDRAAAARRVVELGETFGLPLDPTARVEELAVGQRQKVEILKVLHRGARVLVLDEPTAVLTPPEVRQLFAMLRRFADDGRTVILITHKLEEVMAIADRVTVLRRGRRIVDLDVGQTSPKELAHHMVGREVALAGEQGLALGAASGEVAAPGRRPESAGPPVLELTGVDVGRGELRPLQQIDLTVRAGEIVGVAGVQGNGQRELLEVVAGLLPASAGTIRLAGQELGGLDVVARRAAGLAHIAEDRQEQGLALDFTVAENLILGRQRQFSRPGRLDRSRIGALARRLIERFDVRPPLAGAPARALSGGNQQKVVIARELACGERPRLLLAGQPTRGVDIGAVEQIHRQLREARDAGSGVLLVSADLAELLALADRIVVMVRGRIVASRRRAEVGLEQLGELMLGGSAGAGPDKGQP